MFTRYTSLVSPSLTRRHANAVEFATKVCFSGSEVITRLTAGYEGEIVQLVAPQKLATCSAYRYKYVHS